MPQVLTLTLSLVYVKYLLIRTYASFVASVPPSSENSVDLWAYVACELLKLALYYNNAFLDIRLN